jgi:hypothetical protein
MIFATKIRVEWDTATLTKRLEAKRKRVLFRQGAYVKTAMQRSMRYSNKPSQPGRPPHAHKRSGAPLRKSIRFEVDTKQMGVAIGPTRTAGLSQPSGKPVPQLLDQGGPVFGHLAGVQITAHIEPRPFTAPVFTDGGENFRKLLEKEPL